MRFRKRSCDTYGRHNRNVDTAPTLPLWYAHGGALEVRARGGNVAEGRHRKQVAA